MDKFIEELQATKVISKDDIETFKKYIDKKYAKNSSKDRASMLSNTIHNILYTKLECIPDTYKSSIKINTLKNTFAQNKTSITMYDIFNSCLAENDLKIKFRNLLTNWVNLHVNTDVDEDDLKTYFENIEKPKKEKENVEASTESYIQEPKSNSLNKINIFKNLKFKHKSLITCSIIFFIISLYPLSKLLLTYTINSKDNFKFYSYNDTKNLEALSKKTNSKFPNSHLPDYMKYRNINETKLRDFLLNRKSFLAKEPYFSTIISTAEEFNLNPLVLFSITGQEQNFVPESEKNASKIANNPFNVFHSWQEYNTDIKDSSKIAARTVINLSKDMPKNSDPFLWVGKNYAEDKNWGKGVEDVFKDLNEKCK